MARKCYKQTSEEKHNSELAFGADKRWQELKNPQAFVFMPDGVLWPYAVVAREGRNEGDYSLLIFSAEGKFITNIATAILESNK